MICKICDSNSKEIFRKIVLLKYDVGYHQCEQCFFIQTDEPFWLSEAYGSAITSLDIGILVRNNYLVNQISKLIDSCFRESNKMLDFAGGYGIFVREMRDSGYDFYRQDIYCENLFSKYFDIDDCEDKKFDLTTAFEVLEHFNMPLEEIGEIFKFSENVIFSTELIPNNISLENWVYISQETGQHIAFYSKLTMEIIAKKFNKNYYCKNDNIHIFTNKILNNEQLNFYDNLVYFKSKYFGLKKRKYIKHRVERESYQQRDYEKIKKILNQK